MSRRRRRALLAGVGAVLLLVLGAVLLSALDDGDGFGLLDDSGAPSWQYLAVFLLIVGDAVCPVFPGETTLNAASTLAAQGVLELGLVILAGALGAIVGDSALYWVARRSVAHVRPRVERAKRNDKVAAGMALLGESAPLLIVAGRYVPGLRFAVNATMGLAEYPYRRFLVWSALGSATWSVYTCLLAYWIGTALADYPLASILISGAVTSVFVVAVFVAVRRHRRLAADGASGRPAAAP